MTFSENGITHSSGKSITFERNYDGRITSIVDPRGNKIKYSYNEKGELVSVTDQIGAETQFVYSDNPNYPEHFIEKVIDPLGHTTVRTEYDDQGRITKTIDVSGNITEYQFDMNGQQSVQRMIDVLGNTTIHYTDSRGNVIREELPGGTVIVRSFDPNGNVLTEIEIIQHQGQEVRLTTTYSYDDSGNKISETDERGNIYHYSYNKYGELSSVSINGTTTPTYYDSKKGLPTYTIDSNGVKTFYMFDDNGNMASMSNVGSFTYNKYGDITQFTTTDGQTLYMNYDVNGDRTSISRIINGVTVEDKFFYDDARRNIRVEHWVGSQLIWSTDTVYDHANQIIKEIDRHGLVTEYTYDPQGNETQVRTQKYDESGKIIWFVRQTVFDALGREICATDEYVDGNTRYNIHGTYMYYDAADNIDKSERLAGVTIIVNEIGRSHLISKGVIVSSTSTEFNSAGWILSNTDETGLRTEYTYNQFGDIIQVKRETVDSLGNRSYVITQSAYDNFGRLVFTTDDYLEGASVIYGTHNYYDDFDRLIKIERCKNVTIEIMQNESSRVTNYGVILYVKINEYNLDGHLISSVDENGNITQYEYDSQGRKVKVILPTGLIEQTKYDSNGRIKEIIIVNVNVTQSTKYEYDVAGNITKTIFDDGTSVTSVYNDWGQIISETNQIGQTRYFTYDTNGRLAAVTLPGGFVYEYEYDIYGNQTLIRDPNGHETRFTYDQLGNMLTRTLPLGYGENGKWDVGENLMGSDFTERFEYDVFGRTILHVSFEGIVTKYIYDDYGRLTEKIYFADADAYNNDKSKETCIYEYDYLNRIVKVVQDRDMIDNDIVTITSYNEECLISSVSTKQGTQNASVIYYEYDMFGRQVKITLDSGETTYYTYDRYGRLASVSERDDTISSSTNVTRYQYDAYGNLIETIMSNGVTTSYEYDKMNRLTRLSNFIDVNSNGILDDGEGISRFTYTLDDLGRKTQAIEEFWADYNGDDVVDYLENKIEWEYDEIDRLIAEIFDHFSDENDQSSQWEYDAVGNRLKQIVEKKIGGMTVTNYTYDANDRLLKEQIDNQNDGITDKIINYGYDRTQQTKKQVTENGILASDTTFEYDAQGRLNKVIISNYKENGIAIVSHSNCK